MGNGMKSSPSFCMNPGGMSDVRMLLVILLRPPTSLVWTGVPSGWQQKGVSLPLGTERRSWEWEISPSVISGESDRWELGDGIRSRASTYMGDSGLPGSMALTSMGMVSLLVIGSSVVMAEGA